MRYWRRCLVWKAGTIKQLTTITLRYCRRCLVWMAGTLCVCNTVFSTLGYPANIHGLSMSPTFNEPPAQQHKKYAAKMMFPSLIDTFQSDWVFVNIRAAKQIKNERKGLKRGVIVVFTSPKDPEEYVIKRVVALENDIVSSRGQTVIIQPGHCWVEGDNAKRSIDSRDYGPIPIGLIFGVCSYIIFPLRRFSALDSCTKVNDTTIVIKNNAARIDTPISVHEP